MNLEAPQHPCHTTLNTSSKMLSKYSSAGESLDMSLITISRPASIGEHFLCPQFPVMSGNLGGGYLCKFGRVSYPSQGVVHWREPYFG